MITREQLEEMFHQIETKTDWDLSEPMLWGYFFSHDEPGRLREAAEQLETSGYRTVDIYYRDAAPDPWWLHVEREEIHTLDSLEARNIELEDFAEEFGLSTYDGVDVGPVGSSPLDAE